MSDLAQEMIKTLDAARDGVRVELSGYGAEPAPDAATLEQLLAAVLSFAAQADGLCLMIAEHDLDDSVMDMAEELSDFFQDVQQQIEEMLRLTSG